MAKGCSDAQRGGEKQHRRCFFLPPSLGDADSFHFLIVFYSLAIGDGCGSDSDTRRKAANKYQHIK